MSFLAGVGIAMQGLSLITDLTGGRLETAANVAKAKEQADTDRFNAAVAEQQARGELEGSQADAADFRRAQSARLAASRASQAASGFVLEGSPLIADQAAVAEIEFGAQRIVSEGRKSAERLRQEGTLLTRSATVEDQNAKLEKSAGLIKSLGTAARGITSIGSTLSTSGVKFG